MAAVAPAPSGCGEAMWWASELSPQPSRRPRLCFGAARGWQSRPPRPDSCPCGRGRTAGTAGRRPAPASENHRAPTDTDCRRRRPRPHRPVRQRSCGRRWQRPWRWMSRRSRPSDRPFKAKHASGECGRGVGSVDPRQPVASRKTLVGIQFAVGHFRWRRSRRCWCRSRRRCARARSGP
jgi:hypothetical protein